jgi:hypothetical protein
MRLTNLARFSLNFALKPVAAGVADVSDCWAVAGNESAPTARQSRPILITLICFSPSPEIDLPLLSSAEEYLKAFGGRISIVHGSAKSNIHDGEGFGLLAGPRWM